MKTALLALFTAIIAALPSKEHHVLARREPLNLLHAILPALALSAQNNQFPLARLKTPQPQINEIRAAIAPDLPQRFTIIPEIGEFNYKGRSSRMSPERMDSDIQDYYSLGIQTGMSNEDSFDNTVEYYLYPEGLFGTDGRKKQINPEAAERIISMLESKTGVTRKDYRKVGDKKQDAFQATNIDVLRHWDEYEGDTSEWASGMEELFGNDPVMLDAIYKRKDEMDSERKNSASSRNGLPKAESYNMVLAKNNDNRKVEKTTQEQDWVWFGKFHVKG